jgi:hypothetical protein
MAFFTILGNFNAIVGFAKTAASAIAGNSPTREVANTIFGTDTGGNGGQSLSVTALTAALEEQLEGVNDFTFDLSTQGSLADSEVALTNVSDFLNGSAVDRSTVVSLSQSGLRNVINAAAGALTAALNARLVVETLEDGALNTMSEIRRT